MPSGVTRLGDARWYSFVEVLAAYLNLSEQMAHLRTALACLTVPDAPADEPGLDAARSVGTA